MDLINTVNITKKYKGQTVLNNVSLHIPENYVYCLLGPNGAGKTTMMKIITGMIKATSGSIQFDGHQWNRSDLKYIGSLIEEAPIYGNLTASENLEVIAKMRNIETNNIDNVLKSVGLGNTGKKLSKNFSLGMKQRLGIAMALIDNPKLLILDEPTNGLDPLGIQELRLLISKLKEQDITILVSSHMLSEVEHLADYIGIINHGSLLLEEEYDHKTNLEELFNHTIMKQGDNNA